MVKLPIYATRETVLMRWIKQFHEKVVNRFGSDAIDTMRATAWQIEEYLDTHGKYRDAEFLRTMQQSLEKIVQERGHTNWTVEKAKSDWRGRTIGVNQFSDKQQKPRRKRPPVSRRLSQEITEKILPRREFDEPQS